MSPAVMMSSFGVGENLLALLHVRAFHAHHERHGQADLLRRLHDALGEDVAAQDAAEDVDEDPAHRRVGEDDLEGRLHLLGIGPTADVEEVGRLAARGLDRVHRRHREAGAVHHAADVALERDVAEVVLRGLDLARILLVRVAQLAQIGMAEERVVVEADLGVERQQVAGRRHHQRVDLRERAIALDERAGERLEERDRLADLLLRQPQAEGDAPRLEPREPDDRIEGLAQDLLRASAPPPPRSPRRPRWTPSPSPVPSRGRPPGPGRARGRSCTLPRPAAGARRDPAVRSGA